jgi:hypothetical protein
MNVSLYGWWLLMRNWFRRLLMFAADGRKTWLPFIGVGRTDRTEFIMSPKVAKVWEAINKRQARDLPGLRKLMKRAAPFATE